MKDEGNNNGVKMELKFLNYVTGGYLQKQTRLSKSSCIPTYKLYGKRIRRGTHKVEQKYEISFPLFG